MFDIRAFIKDLRDAASNMPYPQSVWMAHAAYAIDELMEECKKNRKQLSKLRKDIRLFGHWTVKED